MNILSFLNQFNRFVWVGKWNVWDRFVIIWYLMIIRNLMKFLSSFKICHLGNVRIVRHALRGVSNLRQAKQKRTYLHLKGSRWRERGSRNVKKIVTYYFNVALSIKAPELMFVQVFLNWKKRQKFILIMKGIFFLFYCSRIAWMSTNVIYWFKD